MELAGDAWEELSGYDGRIAATFRALLHPGRLTIDYLSGHRARYLKPVRLYLIVSVAYFVLASAAPNLQPARNANEVAGPLGMRIGVTGASGMLTDEDRAELLKDLETAPWYLRSILTAAAEDPDAFRARIFTTMPRVFFALLPVFAGIVALFYRGRRFPTAMVFAVHLHAFAFLVFTVSEAAKFSYVFVFSAVVSIAALVAFVLYALSAFRAVYAESWPKTVAKASGIGLAYLVTSIPAFIIILAWASLA
jgi:hypothetical protein